MDSCQRVFAVCPAADKRHRSIDEAAEAIVVKLQTGLPLAFQRQEPVDEVDLQNGARAVLSAYSATSARASRRAVSGKGVPPRIRARSGGHIRGD